MLISLRVIFVFDNENGGTDMGITAANDGNNEDNDDNGFKMNYTGSNSYDSNDKVKNYNAIDKMRVGLY